MVFSLTKTARTTVSHESLSFQPIPASCKDTISGSQSLRAAFERDEDDDHHEYDDLDN